MAHKPFQQGIDLPAPFIAGSCDPIDPRLIVENKEDLTTNAATTFGLISGIYCKVYQGITVYVTSELSKYMYIGPAVENNGVLLTDVQKEENWVKVADPENISKLDNINNDVQKINGVLGLEDIEGAVDLGLPSGTLWADKNIGASTSLDPGFYFQWASTEGYTIELINSGEFSFDYNNYKHSGEGATSSSPQFTKYCNKASYGKDGTFTDSLTSILSEDDAAHVHMGGNWKIPTIADFKELFSNTNKELIYSNGTVIKSTNSNNDGFNWNSGSSGDVLGMKFINRSDSSKFIFIPLYGSIHDSWTESINKYNGVLLINDLNTSDCRQFKYFSFDSSGANLLNYESREYGMPIRGVISTKKNFYTIPETDTLINTVKTSLNSHISNRSNPHGVTKAQVGLGNVTNDAQVKRSEMGVANGVATLDSSGKVPSSQLPSYVDDIIDVYATYTISDTGAISDVNLYLDAAHTQPVTGESGKIYLNVTENEPAYQFRWTGTVFAQTGASSLIIGEVEGTAFDGKKGKDLSDLVDSLIKAYTLYWLVDTGDVSNYLLEHLQYNLDTMASIPSGTPVFIRFDDPLDPDWGYYNMVGIYSNDVDFGRFFDFEENRWYYFTINDDGTIHKELHGIPYISEENSLYLENIASEVPSLVKSIDSPAIDNTSWNESQLPITIIKQDGINTEISKLTTSECILPSATTEKAGVMSASDKTTLDELANLVIADKTTLNFAANPANIEKGVNTTVTLNWSIYFSGELVEISSLDVKKGSTTILTDTGRRQTTDTISDTTSYSVTIGYRGITKTTSKTVNAYYPKYYGGSAKATITADDVTTFTKLAISGSAAGTYNITSADNQYIWFCIPSSMNINKVTLGGFAVPLESPITLAVTGKGNYKCYRSSNPLSAGTRSFVIS